MSQAITNAAKAEVGLDRRIMQSYPVIYQWESNVTESNAQISRYYYSFWNKSAFEKYPPIRTSSAAADGPITASPHTNELVVCFGNVHHPEFEGRRIKYLLLDRRGKKCIVLTSYSWPKMGTKLSLEAWKKKKKCNNNVHIINQSFVFLIKHLKEKNGPFSRPFTLLGIFKHHDIAWYFSMYCLAMMASHFKCPLEHSGIFSNS